MSFMISFTLSRVCIRKMAMTLVVWSTDRLSAWTSFDFRLRLSLSLLSCLSLRASTCECDCVTMSRCDCVTVKLCDCVTVTLCDCYYGIVWLCHCGIVWLCHYGPPPFLTIHTCNASFKMLLTSTQLANAKHALEKAIIEHLVTGDLIKEGLWERVMEKRIRNADLKNEKQDEQNALDIL